LSSVTPQFDGDSCGILANNALQHFVDPINMLLLDSQPGSIIEQCLGVFNAIAQNDTAWVSLYHRFTPQSMLTQSKLDDCPDKDFNYIPAKGDSESVSDDDEPINADQLSPGFPMSTTCSPRVFLPTLSTVPEHLAVILNTFPNIPILATYTYDGIA
jgi:hypothetical protein